VNLELLSQGQNGLLIIRGERGDDIMRFTERAFQLAATATPAERHRINGHFQHTRTGTPEDPEKVAKAAAAWEALAALQPDDDAVMVLLQNCYRVLGRERDAASLDLRLAEARPRNIVVNFRVAMRMLREGNFDAARRYALRAESALSPGMPSSLGTPPLVTSSASIRLFPAYIAWLEDNPREVLNSLDQVAATADRLTEAERREIRMRLWPLYAAIGRIRQAEPIVNDVRPRDLKDVAGMLAADMSKADFLEHSGDVTRLRELVAQWRDPLPDDVDPALAARATYFIRVGRFDAAERDLAWSTRRFKQLGWPTVVNLTFDAEIELARGRPDAAIALLHQARNPDAELGFGQYARAATLALALEATGKVAEAAAALEEAGKNRIGAVNGNMAIPFANALNRWTRGRAQLARLYRKNGQTGEAEAVESQLLKLLAVADADYPLLLELRGRTGAPTRAD
jgi:tetratricopeptide (TPR) repeat protein